MTREKLVELKITNHKSTIISSLISTLIGELDRVGKNLSSSEVIKVMKKLYNSNQITLDKMDVNDPRHIILVEENTFLGMYLPDDLSTEFMYDEVQKCINDKCDNIGSIMKHFKTNFEGRYDGKTLSQIIKQLL